jgi:hypothetical protein
LTLRQTAVRELRKGDQLALAVVKPQFMIIRALILLILSTDFPLARGVGGHIDTPETDFPREQERPPGGSSAEQIVSQEDLRLWGASLSTGWTSRQVDYGVDETGNYGAYTTELAFRLQSLTLSVWSAFGTGNDYQEWDFTAGYSLQLGPLFLTPGYNFWYQPRILEGGHSHDASSHELFFVLGTTIVPYVTPSMFLVWDLNNMPGVYTELRCDVTVPLYRDVLSFEPYALLGLNFGYNTRDYYGWNNFQFGLKATWKINRFVSIFSGVNYSIALAALRTIDQGNEVWASTGMILSY